jgi:hypothetical protein
VNLHIYRSAPAEALRHDDVLWLGGGRFLVLEEVHLTRDGVRVGGTPPVTNSKRRSWVDFKYGDTVRVAATEDDVQSVLRGLDSALGFASIEWDSRNDDTDVAPPWRRLQQGDGTIDLLTDGRWFTLDPHEADVTVQLDEDGDEDPAD